MTAGHSSDVSGSAPFATLGTDDEAEFDRVYEENLDFVWRSLRGLGVAESEVEDATHEVFVVLHRRWADWDRRSKVTTWLFGIARGVARNVLRSRRRAERKLRAVEANVSSDSGRFTNPEIGVDRNSAAARLAEFLETLDPPKRRVFELCEIEGLSAAEAGRCLRENPNTVSTRLRRARKAFTKFVSELAAQQ